MKFEVGIEPQFEDVRDTFIADIRMFISMSAGDDVHLLTALQQHMDSHMFIEGEFSVGVNFWKQKTLHFRGIVHGCRLEHEATL